MHKGKAISFKSDCFNDCNSLISALKNGSTSLIGSQSLFVELIHSFPIAIATVYIVE